MLKKTLIFALLLLGTGSLWILESVYKNIDLQQWYLTFLWLTLIYFVFKITLEGFAARRIHDNKNRYKFRKIISLVYLLIATIVLVRIWVDNPQSLLVAYGVVGAGVAIALQDIFKNFVGGLSLFINNLYKVGDRIQIDDQAGDVIDISLFYTTLLEIRGWVDGDQSTGRLTTIPNGKILSTTINNYTKDHHFMWEEITVPITYESNWRKAKEIIQTNVANATESATATAEKGIKRIGNKYYLSRRNIEPAVFLSITDNWIDFKVRFVVEVRNRRLTYNEIMENILESIQKEDDISIASETLTITKK